MSRFVTFVTRQRCHLCDDALEALWPWARRLGLTVVEVDVDDDPALLERFGDRVPVVVSASGAVLAEGRISPREAALAAVRARVTRRPAL